MMTVTHVQFPEDSLAYEEVLNWLGFAFETGHIYPTTARQRVIRDGDYGMAEANRIMLEQSNLFIKL